MAVWHRGCRRRRRCQREERIHLLRLRRFKSFSFGNVLRDSQQSWDASVRGRAGFLVTPWTLAYGTVGVAFGSVGGSFSYAANESSSYCMIAIPVVCFRHRRGLLEHHPDRPHRRCRPRGPDYPGAHAAARVPLHRFGPVFGRRLSEPATARATAVPHPTTRLSTCIRPSRRSGSGSATISKSS